MLVPTTVPKHDLEHLIHGTHWNPRSILGPHIVTTDGKPSLVIRAWLPYAVRVEVLHDSSEQPRYAASTPAALSGSPLSMTRIHETGLFEAVVPMQQEILPYRLRIMNHEGTTITTHDPYAFPLLLTDFELHLFTEGTLYKAYDSFGAHIRTVDNVSGVHFVVWAPNAARVSVVGDFNQWDGQFWTLGALYP
jgi:1,4-alpha-glucan branching enzyme